MRDALTDVPGLKVGHWTNPDAGTGCTVVLCEQGVIGRGGRTWHCTRHPGDRSARSCLHGPRSSCDTHRRRQRTVWPRLTASVRWLRNTATGSMSAWARLIVPAACLFDLPLRRPHRALRRRGRYAACAAATADDANRATWARGRCATGGQDSRLCARPKAAWARRRWCGPHGLGALVAVNAFGHVVDPDTGAIIAGARQPGGGFVDTVAAAQSWVGRTLAQLRRTNTTLAVVATNARLDKAGATKVAWMAQDGLACAIRPAHTHFDGDTVFALSTGDVQADLSLVGAGRGRPGPGDSAGCACGRDITRDTGVTTRVQLLLATWPFPALFIWQRRSS
ncbi:MAG: P1 family peptidase [Caldilineaceae bacterium]